MRTSKAVKLAAVPDQSNSPIALAQVEDDEAGKALALEIKALTAARVDLKRATDDFDEGRISVEAKVKVSELLGRSERRYERAVEAKKATGAKLEALHTAARKARYEAEVEAAQNWLVLAKPYIDSLVERVVGAMPTLEAIADVVVESASHHAEAVRMEPEVQPLFSLVARGIRAVDLAGVKYVFRVALGRALASRGLELPGDDWFVPAHEPRVGDALADTYARVVEMLEPKGASK